MLEPGVLEPGVLEPGVLEPGVLEPGVLAAGGGHSRAQMPLRCDISAAFLSRKACMQVSAPPAMHACYGACRKLLDASPCVAAWCGSVRSTRAACDCITESLLCGQSLPVAASISLISLTV